MTVFRAWLAVLLLLNGLAMQPATATPVAAGSMSHAGHGLDAPQVHQHGDSSSADCCEISACDCGCAVPQAATPPVVAARAGWQAALTVFAHRAKSVHSSVLPAPFRPPA